MTQTKSASKAQQAQERLPGLAGRIQAGTNDERLLALKDVVPNPDNKRRSFDEDAMRRFCQGLQARGLKHPIEVKPHGKKYRIVHGHFRFEAHKRLGWQVIPAKIVEDHSAATEVLDRIIENLHRADLQPIEEAQEFQDALRIMSKKDLCEQAGIAYNTLKARLALLELPHGLGELVGHDGFSMAHARALEPFYDHESAMTEAKAVIAEGKAPPAAKFVERVATRLKQQKQAVDAYAWQYAELRRHPDYEALVRALPHVAYREQGYRDVLLVLDVDRFEAVAAKVQAMLDVEAKRAEAEAEGSAVLADEAEGLLEAAEYDRALQHAVADAAADARLALDEKKRSEALGHLRKAASPAEAFQAALVALRDWPRDVESAVASIAGVQRDRLSAMQRGRAVNEVFKVSKQVTPDKLLRALAYLLLAQSKNVPWVRLACLWQDKDAVAAFKAAEMRAEKEARTAFEKRVGARPTDDATKAKGASKAKA